MESAHNTSLLFIELGAAVFGLAILARLAGPQRWRAGIALIPRGEFSIVIAALGGGLEPKLEPLSAAYVLFLAIAGPIVARAVK